MPCRSNLGYHTTGAEAVRRIIENQTEEEQALVKTDNQTGKTDNQWVKYVLRKQQNDCKQT